MLSLNIGGTAVNLAVVWPISAARGLVKGSPRFARPTRRSTALIVLGLALRLAASGRS